MKRKFFAFVLLLSACISLSSCLSNDDDTEVVYSHDTAITAFSLGTMTRTYYAPEKAKDTTVTVAGADYKFDIDHLQRTITNADSLPVGTRTAAALATISAKNSSYIQLVYKNQANEDSLAWYSSTDSINFDNLKAVRAYAQDGSVYADYAVKLKVHKEEADSFLWQAIGSEQADIANLTAMKAVAANGKVYVFGKSGNELKAYQCDGNAWTALSMDVTKNALGSEEAGYKLDAESYKSVAVLDGNIYLINVADGKVFVLNKGQDAWLTLYQDADFMQLVGADDHRLYAYTGTRDANGKVTAITGLACGDGKAWTASTLDNAAGYLPTESVNVLVSSIRSTHNAANVLLLGNRDKAKNDTIASLWNCTVDYTAGSEARAWNYVEYDQNTAGKLPYLSQLAASTASDGLVALGSNGKWYKSVNSGLTWAVDTLMTLPKDFDATHPFALVRVKIEGIVTDLANPVKYNVWSYWLIGGGKTWKGRFNKDGWLRTE